VKIPYRENTGGFYPQGWPNLRSWQLNSSGILKVQVVRWRYAFDILTFSAADFSASKAAVFTLLWKGHTRLPPLSQ